MLKIEYVCHSCLHIDTGDTTLAFDPWFKGTAYNGQWYLFPQPLKTDMLRSTENILISHGHDDHLHAESLAELSKKTSVFFPYQWRKGIKDFLHNLGFRQITEAITFHPYQISPTTVVTYIAFGLESVIVIETNGKVIVNINDALNSHHENVVKMFLTEIKSRWPVIDFLFSGWSGAGYFPNTVHFKGKDDIEIGRLREQYFANNFCKFIKYLQPKRAIPFAPGFALLGDNRRWINEVKFPRTKAEKYYRDNFDTDSTVEFGIMHPGDYYEDGLLIKASSYHSEVKDDSYYHLIDKVFEKEIKEFNTIKKVEENTVLNLEKKMAEILNFNSRIYDAVVLDDVNFAVILTDLENKSCFNIDRKYGHFIVQRSGVPFPGRKLIIKTSSRLLSLAFEREWGADAMTIGYGLDIEVFEESSLEKNLDLVCVRLLSLYPRASEYLFKQPFRTLTWLATNPLMASLAVTQKLRLRSAVNKFPYNERDHWISYSKCDLCQVCNMPMLSEEFTVIKRGNG